MITTDELRRAAPSPGALPTSLHRLLAITAVPDFDVNELIDVIDHDMGLTAAMLRRAIAAAAAPLDRVPTVRRAVVRIGAVETLSVAMNSVVGGLLQRELRRYRRSALDLWRHSCAASLAATQIRAAATVSLPASTATTALLHDIGKVALDRVSVAGAAPDLSMHDAALRDAELEAFGMDHAQAGALLAEMWRLPPAIVEGIAAHHLLVDDALPSATCLADDVAHRVELGDDAGQPGVVTEESRAAAASAGLILGIDEAEIDRIAGAVRGEMEHLSARFGVAEPR